MACDSFSVVGVCGGASAMLRWCRNKRDDGNYVGACCSDVAPCERLASVRKCVLPVDVGYRKRTEERGEGREVCREETG